MAGRRGTGPRGVESGMTTAEDLALAVLRGDTTAAYALCDKLKEDSADFTHLPLPPVKAADYLWHWRNAECWLKRLAHLAREPRRRCVRRNR